MPAHSETIRAGARDLYIAQGWSVRAIASHLQLSPSTVQTWSRAGDWSRARHCMRELRVTESADAAALLKADQDCMKLIPRLIKVMSLMTDRFEALIDGRTTRTRVPFEFTDLVKGASLIATYYSLVTPAKLQAELKAMNEAGC